MSAIFRALWEYRGFILGSVKREFQSKYRNSLLGAAWTVLNPLSMIVVYTVIFAEVMRSRLPGVDNTFGYSIYLCAGILSWGLFAEIVSRAQNVFIDNANLLKKLSFPRLCLPLVIIVSALLNFGIIFGLFIGFLVLSGNFPGGVVFAVVPLLVILTLFAIGLGVTLGVLNVFFRDVGQFFSIFLTFWFWLTPIVYPANTLPNSFRGILAFNPMVPLMEGFQAVFVRRVFPQWGGLLMPGIYCVVLCFVGLMLFRKHAGEIVDEL